MQPVRFPRFRLALCLLSVLAAGGLFGCSVSRNPAVNPDPGQYLAEKVKTNKYAYLRYDQAEEEARHDGNTVAATRYRQAKEEALANYNRYEKELRAFEAEHRLKIAKEQTP